MPVGRAAAVESRAPAPPENSWRGVERLRILGACWNFAFVHTCMQRLFVNPKYERVFGAQGWSSFSRVFEHFLPNYSRRKKVTVEGVSIPDGQGHIDAFFKLYHLRASKWSFWLRATKARCEFENYATFERLGVPAADRIAWGEERNLLGCPERAFIITRAVPDACELDGFFRDGRPHGERLQVLRELAEIVRRLHEAHFYHYDLVWRNILVSRNSRDGPRLFLIDCPRGGFAQFGRARKRLRDLASLDKSAAQFCSRAERLRFLLLYAGKRRVDDDFRSLIRACLEYRRTRWPEDWRGK
jgi:tRNA A-37 threonylcarbamoyl transferase component Bud32